jgi:hypothetical protein
LHKKTGQKSTYYKCSNSNKVREWTIVFNLLSCSPTTY